VEAALQFLFNAMAPKADERFPFGGRPRYLYLDNGPVVRRHVFQQVMGSLDIEFRTHLPSGHDGRRTPARSKGKVERPFRTVKEAHETLYPFHEPQSETEANAWLFNYLLRYNDQPHRSESPSRMEDWQLHLPPEGLREMCSWERFCTFAREPEQRKVAVDAQVSVAGAAVAQPGFSWQLSDSGILNAGFSVFWIVGLTNSFNLLDNMDGLTSTAAACALVITAALAPQTAVFALPLAGAVVGFLVINRPPARMYMGDAGSLMLGFGIAVCTIWAANSTRGLHSFVILVFPVAIALFDTSLVVVSRLMTGRPVQLGGKDHFSHRLRLLGWSPLVILAVTVWASTIAWACAALALLYPQAEAWLAIPIALAFVAAWAVLLRVDPYVVADQPRVEVYRDQTGT